LTLSCSTQKLFKETTDWEKENLNGKIKSTSIFQDSVLLNKTDYNKLGFKTKSIFYNHNGDLRNENNFEYINGFLASITSEFADGKVYKTIYERDNRNRIIKETSIYPNGEVDSRIEFEYNDSDQIIKRTYIPKNNNSYCYTFEYGLTEKKEIHCTYGLQYLYELSDGLVIKRNEYKSNGEIHMGHSYEYNEYKDVILELELWNNKETDRIKYNYEYDSTGNWLIKVQEWKSGGKSKIRREIIYY
jgi:hypothetical protein